ncbi:MAG: type VI secretion system baseplate subunit TssF [Pirellulales bacterium]
MDPNFLRLYNEELQYIREKGGEFAREFPKIAGRLGMEEFECADPYVERLLEGFAFLTARVRRRMDAEFPRFTQHLLEMVYPHYLSPVPSMTVVQFQLNPDQGDLTQGYPLPRNTVLRGQLGRDDQTACEYRTGPAATLWPINVVEAEYFNREVTNVTLPDRLRQSKAGLRLRLRCLEGLTFSQLALNELVVFLRGGPLRTHRLYEQILAATQAVVVRPSSARTGGEILPQSAVQSVGFADEEALLPVTARSFQGYRLLQEYFAFPPRFLFFKIGGLQPIVQRTSEASLDLLLLFPSSDRELETVVDASNFALNCTSAINLFPQRADRIHLNHHDHEHHVVPDRIRPLDLEVFSLERVTGFAEAGGSQGQEFRPFYAVSDPQLERGVPAAYYTVRREPRLLSEKQQRTGARSSYVGSEVFVSIVDTNATPFADDLAELDVHTLCTNRDLPLVMPVNRGTTDFNLQIGAPVKSIRCVAGPTEPRPPLAMGDGANTWRLINHLSLNYLSLVDTDAQQGAAALRSLLALYADPQSPGQLKQVDALRKIASRTVVRRIPGPGPLSFGRGVEITLDCDEAAFEGSGAFLLGAVLARFFARYVSLNFFTETVLRSTSRGEVMRWPATIGNRQII